MVRVMGVAVSVGAVTVFAVFAVVAVFAVIVVVAVVAVVSVVAVFARIERRCPGRVVMSRVRGDPIGACDRSVGLDLGLGVRVGVGAGIGVATEVVDEVRFHFRRHVEVLGRVGKADERARGVKHAHERREQY